MNAIAHLFPRPAGDHRFGFVIALRATLTDSRDAERQEWMIAARWGNNGEYLSFAWTGTPVTSTQAPPNLAPARSALALRPDWPAGAIAPDWLFRAILPDEVQVAGSFLPAHGHVSVNLRGTALRLVSEGYDLAEGPRSAWRIEAERVPWIGEFIEAGFISDDFAV